MLDGECCIECDICIGIIEKNTPVMKKNELFDNNKNISK